MNQIDDVGVNILAKNLRFVPKLEILKLSLKIIILTYLP